jgi:hypothetical protein
LRVTQDRRVHAQSRSARELGGDVNRIANALGHDRDSLAGLGALNEVPRNSVEVERSRRVQDVVDRGRAGNRQRQMLGWPSQRLEHKGPARQRPARNSELIDDTDRIIDCGIHPDRDRGSGDVVVDRRRDERDRAPGGGKQPGAFKRAAAADYC